MKKIIGCLLSMLFVSTAQAAAVTIPNTFTAGTTSSAAQVNTTFTAVKTAVDDNDARINGLMPVGSIIAWYKSLTGVPALSGGWVECNGQTLNDAASLLNGQVIPNLNGAARFLRGGNTSGTLQAEDLKSHNHTLVSIGWGAGVWNPGMGRADGNSPANSWNNSTTFTGGAETRPINMSVICIMRVK